MYKIIPFDGDYSFCNYSVNFVINYDKKNHFKFAPLISSYARIQLEKFNISHLEFDTFILIDAADYFIKSDAALRVVKYFDHPLKYLIVFQIIPAKIRDIIYDFISRYRKRILIEKITCQLPDENARTKIVD